MAEFFFFKNLRIPKNVSHRSNYSVKRQTEEVLDLLQESWGREKRITYQNVVCYILWHRQKLNEGALGWEPPKLR